ncbi:MAG: serine/threonine protein kinase, partial [Oscillatoria sp. PMC 1051.18]|nr:serine/threonine protein kinase [Oscillatoria sp. PMC 1050.18]MEC5033334.1 serine/threonine protein kinase [Oscillatoria sp. PMC 1051.18]
MTLAFYNLAAELAMLCGEFEVMEQFVDTAIAQAHTLLEQINVYRTRIFSNICQNKLTSAIDIARGLLEQLGVTFPDSPTENDIQQAMAEIEQLIGNRKIEDLVHLPQMIDEEKIAIVQIVNPILPVAFIIGSPLFPLLVSLLVKLFLQYGNTSASAYGYICYSIILCNRLQDVDLAVQFSQLASNLILKFEAKEITPSVVTVQAIFIIPRKSHIKETLLPLNESYITALEVGDLDYVGRSAYTYCVNAFWSGRLLIPLEEEARAYCNGLVQLKQLTTANYCRIYWQSVLNLLQTVEHTSILSGEALQEAELLPHLIEANDFFGLYFFYLCKLMLAYLFKDIQSAQHHAAELKRYLVAGFGLIIEPTFYFYDSLTVLATLSPDSEETVEALEKVKQNQTQLQQHWAYHAPMNYQHKVDLVEAEKCRVLGQKAEAIEFYDRAISGAKTNEYIHEEALANELAAKFFLDWGKPYIAQDYIIKAYYGYAHWGAKAKVADLEKRYPQLL